MLGADINKEDNITKWIEEGRGREKAITTFITKLPEELK